jgi:hypothetical protein
MLTYELRLNGRAWAEYSTLEQALEGARAAVICDPDCDPEIIDQRTGQVCMESASKRWREEIAELLG